MNKQVQANQAAWAIFQDARKNAASNDNREEWQRLYRITHALDVALEKKGATSN